MNEIKADNSGECIPEPTLDDSTKLLHRRWHNILAGDVYPQSEPSEIEAAFCRSINDVIDDISILVEQQNNELTYLQGYFYIGFRCCPPLIQTWEIYGLDWEFTNEEHTCGVALVPSQERIKELNQDMYDRGNHPPKLSPAQIQEITLNYPFQLSVEFHRLYQRANGIFPIGIGSKDWNSFNNYFILNKTGWEESLLDLQSAMYMYQGFSNYKIDPHLFPIMSFENDVIWAVMASEEQKDISPIYAVSVEGGEPKIIWSSLAEMLSAWLYQRNTKQD
ncbi:SMI1/KNR4 family protein [Chamaesiphon sp. OTE_20_metabat_361]|uniref:SMI1/KNR4 family protein n=1 Tax=Chamaesiphon sp. OTE_20_metabat_361 TaxID=2964689 RepID=UPI00286B8C6B|nr:SMI1/KNR4 family protein [Chamaesiphon sp. OTE_20_metabat_361]